MSFQTRCVMRIPLGLLFAVIVAGTIPVAAAEQRGVQLDEGTISAADFGTYRAVIIGINHYESWKHLEFAERDARELRDILVELYAFAPENVVTLLGSEATESRIMNSLRDMLETSKESDNVLIYYAGHGQLDPTTNTGFWIPVRASGRDDSTWIPFTFVINLLTADADKVRAKSVAVITDSCYGGALLSTRSGRTPGVPEPKEERYVASLRDFATQRSREVIASGGFEEVPDRSQFAELLKAALRANALPMVDLEFIFWEKVFPTMRRMGDQKPTMQRLIRGLGEDGLFVFLRSEPTRETATDSSLEVVEIAFWDSIKDSDNPVLFREYLRRFPDGLFVVIANDRLGVLELVVVPPVEGMSEGIAKEALQGEGLHVGEIKRRESAHARGTVLTQSPAAGSEVRRGTAIDLTVAAWPTVPDVVGLRKDDALSELRSRGFEAKTSYSRLLDGRRPQSPDTVFDQIPSAGHEAEPGTTVSLLLTGVIVPELIGLDAKVAAVTLEKAGLKLGRTKTKYLASERAGTVIDQSMKPGTTVEPGLEVDVSVAAVTSPRLLAPQQGTILDNGCNDRTDPMAWYFEWSEVPGASDYELLVNGPNASVPAIHESSLSALSHREQSSAYVAAHNLRGWRWKVRARVRGAWGAWSDERTFDVEPVDTDCTAVPPDVGAEDRCYELVQGRIAWNYEGTKNWSPANVKRLCRGTSRPAEPARCFDRAMHGGIDWGAGTRWAWANAVDLCEGTDNAARTIDCFQGELRQGRGWPEAIGSCSK